MKNKIFGVAFSILIASCGRFDNKEESLDSKERIVCVSKQYNEIIFALGAEKDIVAVDISSSYPNEIKKLPTVGYHRALVAEGILSMKPTIILHDNNIGPDHVVKQLEDMKIPMKYFKNEAKDLKSTQGLIKEMGLYFKKEKRANELIVQLENDMQVALDEKYKYSFVPKVLIIHYGQASNHYLVVTNKSTAAKMINWAGGFLPVSGKKGMRQLSPEIIAKANPDVILLTDFGYDRLGSMDKIKELPGISATNAAKNNKIFRVEEHDLIYLGPRSGKITLALEKLIHQ